MTKNEKLALAHRYLYYIEFSPVITDFEYDMLEKKALEECDENSTLNKPGSDLKSSYSDEIIELAEKLKQ